MRQGPEIRTQDLSVEFSTGQRVASESFRAINRATTNFSAAQVTSLVGPSGCGKTTLLRVIAGLQKPTSGEVTITPARSNRNGDVAFVFQQPALLPWRTTIENVMLPLRLLKRRTAKDGHTSVRQRAAEVLADVGLDDSHDRLPHQLSGGMKMRVSIARALVTRPSILLLDEPFAALDDMLRTQLGELVLQLWDQRRFTAVMVTHNIGEAILLSHDIVVMRGGRCDAPISNTLPWPRSSDQRRTSQFGDCFGRVSDRLRDDTTHGSMETRDDN